MSYRAFEIMANLAKRRPLRGIQTVCETQHQISTRKLEHYAELAGDELAGYAFNLRNEFDKISKERDAALKQAEGFRSLLHDAKAALDPFDDKILEARIGAALSAKP
jgi:hypothetical protein